MWTAQIQDLMQDLMLRPRNAKHISNRKHNQSRVLVKYKRYLCVLVALLHTYISTLQCCLTATMLLQHTTRIPSGIEPVNGPSDAAAPYCTAPYASRADLPSKPSPSIRPHRQTLRSTAPALNIRGAQFAEEHAQCIAAHLSPRDHHRDENIVANMEMPLSS